MRYVWATAVKDLRRRLRDPLALVLWLGIPFAVLTLLSLAFGGGTPSSPPATATASGAPGTGRIRKWSEEDDQSWSSTWKSPGTNDSGWRGYGSSTSAMTERRSA